MPRTLKIEANCARGSLEKLVLYAASEGAFSEAVGLVERMRSPSNQTTTLLEIATHHADSATVLDPKTQALLTEIEQTAQTSSCCCRD